MLCRRRVLENQHAADRETERHRQGVQGGADLIFLFCFKRSLCDTLAIGWGEGERGGGGGRDSCVSGFLFSQLHRHMSSKWQPQGGSRSARGEGTQKVEEASNPFAPVPVSRASALSVPLSLYLSLCLPTTTGSVFFALKVMLHFSSIAASVCPFVLYPHSSLLPPRPSAI